MVKMIENYTLLQVIGEGNYGKVYRAKNIKTNHQYAIKIIPSQKLHQNSKLQQCTMNEIQTLNLIGQSDHIIMYYQMLKTKNNYYFVYEYCNGGTLMDLLSKEHHLQEDKAVEIFKQLLEAFKVLNRLNIMHRDLKPENIFFANNKVKLGDFGFCKGLRPEENMTKTMLGSPIYMAPQVLKGQAYSTKADIWSLGVILYEMLYGVCPFQSSSIAMLISTINNSSEISLPSNIKITQKSQQLLKKLLTKDYFRRIGWIELFSWFDQKSSTNAEEAHRDRESLEGSIQLIKQKKQPSTSSNQHEKQNVFKIRGSYVQDNNHSNQKIIQEWLSNKNKKVIDFASFKQRSVSQDLMTKKNLKYDVGSLENISPSNSTNLQQKVTLNLNPNLNGYLLQKKDEQQNKQGQPETNYVDKSFSSMIREPSSFQYNQQINQTKPSSLPKKQLVFGYSSAYKPQNNKKVFYSQNYQNIFSTPINDKNKNFIENESFIKLSEKKQKTQNTNRRSRLENQFTTNETVNSRNQSTKKSNLVNLLSKPVSTIHNNTSFEEQNYISTQQQHDNNYKLSLPSSSLQTIPSNSKTPKSTVFNPIKKQQKNQKRQKLLSIHLQCSNLLKQTYSRLQERRQSYLRLAYVIIKSIILRLKRLTTDILINQIDLLDISSLVNYEVIQLERMIVDVKDEIKLNGESLPEGGMEEEVRLICQEIHLYGNSDELKQFMVKRLEQDREWDLLNQLMSCDNKQSDMQVQKNFIEKNISIIDMLPRFTQQDQNYHHNNSKENKDDPTFQIITHNQIYTGSPTNSSINNNNTNTSSMSQRHMKSHYHTTNSFAEYYKNLIENKDKGNFSHSKISIN